MFKLDMIVHDSFFPFDRAADSARLFFGQCNHNRDVTGKAKPERTGGKSKWIASYSHIARFRQTIMNYHGPFDHKHDS